MSVPAMTFPPPPTSAVDDRPATRNILIGDRVLAIAGLDGLDPYFAGLTDDYEPEFRGLCDAMLRPGDSCVDLGANIGVKSLLMAQHVPHGRVLAVEAAPGVAALLARNVAASGLGNIAIAATAVGDRDGTAFFQENSAYGHLAAQGVAVPIRTLGSLLTEQRLDRLDFLKIDVEGNELAVLQNSVDLLGRHGTVVLLEFNTWAILDRTEINPKHAAQWIFDNFSHVFRLHRGGLHRLPRDGALTFLHTNLVEDHVVSDLLVTNAEGRLDGLPADGRLAFAPREIAAPAPIDEAPPQQREPPRGPAHRILEGLKLRRPRG